TWTVTLFAPVFGDDWVLGAVGLTATELSFGVVKVAAAAVEASRVLASSFARASRWRFAAKSASEFDVGCSLSLDTGDVLLAASLETSFAIPFEGSLETTGGVSVCALSVVNDLVSLASL